MTILMPTSLARLDLTQRLQDLAVCTVDAQAAGNLALLLAKVRAEPCTIAFCGHFSAGKSTLINTLAGAPVLPASPIPTSANRVTIRHGNPGATVQFKEKAPLELPTDELNRLSSYCVDGDQVEAVAVRYPLQHVPESLWLMDTPGIDSTDDAHRVATESALYLADVVFYVMDYNHVQSEVNFQFTRALTQWGKPLYLVINQVDKHVELELPFAAFRQSVQDAFAAWGVQPQGIFYTSMRELNHPLSEWPQLLATLTALGEQAEPLLLQGVWQSARHLMQEVDRQHLQQEADVRADLARQAAAAGDLTGLAAEQARLAAAPQQAEENVRRQIDALIKNAPLVPYHTRELASSYLESRKPGFKVGLLFAAAKTEQEVQRRLAAWHAGLTENLQAQLLYHLRELLLQLAAASDLLTEELRAQVAALHVELPAQWLADVVQPASVGNAQYLLKYTDDAVAEIATRCRRAVEPWVEALRQQIADRCAARLAELAALSADVAQAQAAGAALTELDAAAASRTAAWAATLGEAPAGVNLPTFAPAPLPTQEATTATYAATTSPMPSAAIPAPTATSRGPAAGRDLLTETATTLSRAAGLVSELTGLAQTARNLESRAVRLRDSRFTVALFGAFSAGKSSFANALMGANVLPVSPNPTTAVITRVMPPTDEHTHGQVHVTWKEAEALTAEVRQAVEALGMKPSGNVARDLKQAAGVSPEDLLPSAKPHAAFLRAANQGYAEVQPKLGTHEIADLTRFADLVADERLACFVQEIELYFDCPLTRQGITLVDTPGADSINARHTGVAFDYIKNADAILFVTYYNHAFSAPDKEFLIQLGRVKDAFALDKMFFIVNAADLASTGAELQGVLAHVQRNLLACGIHEPRLFPVSSQTALWSRLWAAGALPDSLIPRLRQRLGPNASPDLGMERSGLQDFEAAFYQFTVTDLSAMAARSALDEVARVRDTVQGWLHEAQADASVRLKRSQALAAAGQAAAAAAADLGVRAEVDAIRSEAEALLYHVRQRVLLRYRDQFPEIFHPSVLRKDHPNLKRALHDCLREILGFVRFDLSQQFRATALYLEKAMHAQAGQVQERLQDVIKAQLDAVILPAYRPEPVPAPEAFGLEEHLLDEAFAPLLKLFKTPEQFFTGGGRHELRDALEQALTPALTAANLGARRVLVEVYEQALVERTEALRSAALAELDAQVQGLIATLEDAALAERLARVAGELATLRLTV